MPRPPPSPPKTRNEVQELQFKADQVTDDSLSSTRRMKDLCNEAKEAGIRTVVGLDDQGEKLDNIEKGMGKINVDMKEAEKNLKGMGNPLSGLFSRNKDGKGKGKKNKKDDAAVAGGPDPRSGLSDAGIPTYGGYCAKITNDAREDEMEENLGEVSSMVANLKHMALDIGSEITNQNAQLDRINLTADENVGRIGAANEKAGKLLK